MRSRLTLALAAVWLAVARPAAGQQEAAAPDSARAQIGAVLRAFYLNLDSRNWDALAAYVLSPKLLERRGAPGDLAMVARDRTRSRGWSHPAAAPVTCPAGSSAAVDAAAIRVDGDWADVSVPRCSGASSGADALGLLYFEGRWRFIYTDLFQAPPAAQTAER